MKNALMAVAITALMGGLVIAPVTQQSAEAQVYSGLKSTSAPAGSELLTLVGHGGGGGHFGGGHMGGGHYGWRSYGRKSLGRWRRRPLGRRRDTRRSPSGGSIGSETNLEDRLHLGKENSRLYRYPRLPWSRR